MEFGQVLALFFLIFIVVAVATVVIANKKGVDVTSFKFKLKVGFGGAIIFIIIPFFFFADIPIKWKIIISIPSIIVGYVYLVVLHKISQRKIKKETLS